MDLQNVTGTANIEAVHGSQGTFTFNIAHNTIRISVLSSAGLPSSRPSRAISGAMSKRAMRPMERS